MKLAIVAALATLPACGFDVHVRAGSDAGADDTTDGDNGGDDGAPPMIDAPLADPVACTNLASAAANLVGCYELEDGVADGSLRDSSGLRADAVSMGLVATQRTKPATSAAATVAPVATTYVPDSPLLDLAGSYTVTMWVRPASVPPASKVLGLYDHEQQYAAVIAKAPSGNEAELRCINTGVIGATSTSYQWTDPVPTGEWSFIACTYTGTSLCAQWWSSTTAHDRRCSNFPIAEDGTHGLALGSLSEGGASVSPLDGSFDSVQVYNRALSILELCSMVGEADTCFQ